MAKSYKFLKKLSYNLSIYGVLNVTVPKLEAKKPAQGLIEIE